jgi:phosphate transport system protein
MPIELPGELTNLRRNILKMGAAVEQRVEQSVEALLTGDVELAGHVRGGDDEIDQMEIDNEEECLHILALAQPVAGDLRFVLAVLRINNELERIADLAKSVAKRSIDLVELGISELPPALVNMAYETRRMFSDALAALAESEASLAQRVRSADDRVDDLQKEVFRWAQTEIPRHVEITSAALDMLSIARKLERIADLSTGIAEDVIFLTQGTVVRHEK